MATTAWLRGFSYGLPWSNAPTKVLIGSFSAGQTVQRIRFAWGFAGYTSPVVTMTPISTNAMFFGLVTTIGPPATDSPPDAHGAANDVAPPSQRWLWWEQRVPQVTAWDSAGGVVTWQSNTPQETTDCKSQVLAPTMAAGSSLNLWATWTSRYPWDPSGSAAAWAWWSVLYRSP